jgi:hypothetical protein
MNSNRNTAVIPAKAGIHEPTVSEAKKHAMSRKRLVDGGLRRHDGGANEKGILSL